MTPVGNLFGIEELHYISCRILFVERELGVLVQITVVTDDLGEETIDKLTDVLMDIH